VPRFAEFLRFEIEDIQKVRALVNVQLVAGHPQKFVDFSFARVITESFMAFIL
jgi:hypothetical protein